MLLNGIVLRVTPYQERGLIALLFSREEGIFPCFLSMTKKEPYSWLEPFVVVKGKLGDQRADFSLLKELTGERWFLGLREKPDAIKAVRSMRDFLLNSVEERHPLPLVYALFIKIIEALDKGADPETMEALFAIKLALHEGTLDIEGFNEETREWVIQAASTRSFAQLAKLAIPLTDFIHLLH